MQSATLQFVLEYLTEAAKLFDGRLDKRFPTVLVQRNPLDTGGQ
jgi:hypothetical protein